MAYVHFDRGYAPCGFLIVKKDGNPYNEADTVLIQTDWDYAGVASNMGWVPCGCGGTDGTINCGHRNAGEMLSEAYEFIADRKGEEFESLDDYLADHTWLTRNREGKETTVGKKNSYGYRVGDDYLRRREPFMPLTTLGVSVLLGLAMWAIIILFFCL